VHLEHAGDVLFLVAVAVEDARAFFEAAAVDADVGEIAVLIVDDLEGQAAEGIFRGELAGDFDLGVGGIVADEILEIRWRGEVVDDAIEKFLDADVFEGGSAEDGVGFKYQRGAAQGRRAARLRSARRH